MGLNELDRRIDKEVERQTREKFASPVGPWTPINQTHPPKMPSIARINPLTQSVAMTCPATIASQGMPAGDAC